MTQPTSLCVPFVGLPGPPGTVTYVDWAVVSALTANPYLSSRSQQGIAADCSHGAFSVQFFVPNGGDVLVIRDYRGLAGGASITLMTDGTTGAAIEQPANASGLGSGTYNLTTSVISANNGVGRWKYSAVLNLWILW